MKIRLCYSVEVDDRYRRAINHRFGRSGLATRADVKTWLMQYGSSADDDILDDLDRDSAGEAEEKAGV